MIASSESVMLELSLKPMSQFYAKSDDEYRCRKAVIGRGVVTISGLTPDGKLGTFTGRVQSVEAGHRTIPGYPLRITLVDSDPPT
jgi:hypothetical protein